MVRVILKQVQLENHTNAVGERFEPFGAGALANEQNLLDFTSCSHSDMAMSHRNEAVKKRETNSTTRELCDVRANCTCL